MIYKTDTRAINSIDGSQQNDFITKKQLDTKANTNYVVLKSGSAMAGNLDMNSNRLERVSTPRSDQYDAMNYKAFEDVFMK